MSSATVEATCHAARVPLAALADTTRLRCRAVYIAVGIVPLISRGIIVMTRMVYYIRIP
jgi:hypothetical protein